MTCLETLEARYFGNGPELSEKEMDELRTLVAERDAIKRHAGYQAREQADSAKVQEFFRVTSGPTAWRNPIVFSGR